jgi:hypothetical protein
MTLTFFSYIAYQNSLNAAGGGACEKIAKFLPSINDTILLAFT